jgi:DNA polymerase
VAIAFAKTDEGFKDLANHSCEKVRALVEARLNNKSTLEETRTQRFIDIAKRGSLPVPIRYYAAHTGRWGGDDKINLQNLPSRGDNKLKDCITAPEGFTLIDCDSSQIEARVLAWLAGQEDLVSSFRKKEDVYVKMASTIYDVPESAVTKEQRFVGKTTILGAGYGMGALRFKDQLRSFGFDMDEAEAKRVIGIYRETNASIFSLWQAANEAIRQLAGGWKNSGCFGTDNLLHYGHLDCNGKHQDPVACVVLPSGLPIMYDNLDGDVYGQNFDYKSRNGRTRLYGGKLVENVCQALARIIIGDQIIRVSKVYPVNLTVHDSIICCIPDEEVSDAVEHIESVMRIGPDWAKGIPLDCESGIGKTYGSCG